MIEQIFTSVTDVLCPTYKKHIFDKQLTSASSQIDLSSKVTAAILFFVFAF
jgi:hypothetical protein